VPSGWVCLESSSSCTRPEAIKLGPVIEALRLDPSFVVKVCVTGQHREMLAQVLELFEIVPDAISS